MIFNRLQKHLGISLVYEKKEQNRIVNLGFSQLEVFVFLALAQLN